MAVVKKRPTWGGPFVSRWLSGHCWEIILAVGTSFSDRFSCGEVAVVVRFKIKSECVKCPSGPEKSGRWWKFDWIRRGSLQKLGPRFCRLWLCNRLATVAFTARQAQCDDWLTCQNYLVLPGKTHVVHSHNLSSLHNPILSFLNAVHIIISHCDSKGKIRIPYSAVCKDIVDNNTHHTLAG